jgi:disulfide bond formation protein DsbB
MTRLLAPRPFALALALLAALALLLAFTLEHGFGLAPCPLCIWERWPWLAVVVAGAGGVALGRPRLGLAVALLALAGNAALSGYHVLIEQGVIALPQSCAGGPPAASIEELRARLAAAAPRCDEISAAFLGVSLAAWNGLASAGLALATLGVLAGWWAGRGVVRGPGLSRS